MPNSAIYVVKNLFVSCHVTFDNKEIIKILIYFLILVLIVAILKEGSLFYANSMHTIKKSLLDVYRLSNLNKQAGIIGSIFILRNKSSRLETSG